MCCYGEQLESFPKFTLLRHNVHRLYMLGKSCGCFCPHLQTLDLPSAVGAACSLPSSDFPGPEPPRPSPAQSMYVQGSSCAYSGDLDPIHVSPAFQAEENVVCNFNCRTTQLVHSCHSVSRRAVSDAGVYLPSLSHDSSFAVRWPLKTSD